jgi:hypothetical protein
LVGDFRGPLDGDVARRPRTKEGSHVRLIKGERSTTIPIHAGNVPRGLLGAILKQTGLDVDDLRRLL